ncbi:MAG: late competence development ComFB family protein [Deltaproteobacteria bacterium]|nr:late competence development ComFB family protein [Deltaproteobacteria bacterium]
MDFEEQYRFGNTSLFKIRNRNELRVISKLRDILKEFHDYVPDTLDIQDIYALTLNKLPAHYVQEGSIVLHEAVDDTTIRDCIREAVQYVRQRPNY